MHLNRTLASNKEKEAREIVHELKLEFYYVDRKMKNIIRSNFTLIVVPNNFIYFRVQTGLKCMLEYLLHSVDILKILYVENGDRIFLQNISIIFI